MSTATKTVTKTQTVAEAFAELLTEYSQAAGVAHSTFEADKAGARYTRIIHVSTFVNTDASGEVRTSVSRSVHAFVENATGLLYKAAGWKAPAKGARFDISSRRKMVAVLDAQKAETLYTGGYLYR